MILNGLIKIIYGPIMGSTLITWALYGLVLIMGGLNRNLFIKN